MKFDRRFSFTLSPLHIAPKQNAIHGQRRETVLYTCLCVFVDWRDREKKTNLSQAKPSRTKVQWRKKIIHQHSLRVEKYVERMKHTHSHWREKKLINDITEHYSHISILLQFFIRTALLLNFVERRKQTQFLSSSLTKNMNLISSHQFQYELISKTYYHEVKLIGKYGPGQWHYLWFLFQIKVVSIKLRQSERDHQTRWSSEQHHKIRRTANQPKI